MASTETLFISPSSHIIHDVSITAVCTKNDTLFIADTTGAVYKIENGTKTLFCQNRIGFVTRISITDNVLWCFKNINVFGIRGWDLRTGKAHDTSSITIGIGVILATCSWGSYMVVLTDQPLVKAFNDALDEKIIYPPFNEPNAYYADAIAVWGDYLCVSFVDGSVKVYSEQAECILKIQTEARVISLTQQMMGHGEFLYIRQHSSILRCNWSGEVTQIYQGDPLKLGYDVRALVLCQGRLFAMRSGFLLDAGQSIHFPKDTVVSGDMFRWMNRVWTISEDSSRLFSWNLGDLWTPESHSTFPLEVRNSIKTLFTMSQLDLFPISNMPNELLCYIIQIVAVQWMPRGLEKFQKKPTKPCIKRRRLEKLT